MTSLKEQKVAHSGHIFLLEFLILIPRLHQSCSFFQRIRFTYFGWKSKIQVCSKSLVLSKVGVQTLTKVTREDITGMNVHDFWMWLSASEQKLVPRAWLEIIQNLYSSNGYSETSIIDLSLKMQIPESDPSVPIEWDSFSTKLYITQQLYHACINNSFSACVSPVEERTK